MMPTETKYRRILKTISFILAISTFLFALVEHYGLLNDIRCTNKLLDYNSRIQTSYANVPRTVIPSSPEWSCVLALIHKYSGMKFPENKPLLTVMRFVATASYEQDVGGDKPAEWTAPSTPLVVSFKPWPGNVLTKDDFIIVGSIGDFENWIEKDKNEFEFKVQNILLGALSLAITFLLL